MHDIQQQIFSELDKFQKLTDEARKTLLDVDGKLKEGYSPEESTATSLFASLRGLRKLYESVFSMIASESNMLEVSRKELSASELRKIAQGINEAEESAKDDLRRFIRIKSSMEAFNRHIQPVQEKAEKLLQRLEQNPTGSARKSALNEAVKYQKFLAMLEQGLTEGNISNAEELSKIFPPMTVIGLTSGKYSIGSEDSDSKPQPAKIPLQPKAQQEVISNPAQVLPEISREPENESAAKEPEENPRVNSKILTARTSVKPKKPSAKAFRDELAKSAMSAGPEIGHDAIELLNIFSHYGILTLRQASDFRVYYIAQGIKDISERLEFINKKSVKAEEDGYSTIKTALEWLERKKAVSFFSRGNDKDDVYCLTKWVAGSLDKAEVRKRFKEPAVGKFLFGADNELSEYDAVNVTQRNSMILDYMFACERKRSIDKLSAILSGTKCTLNEASVPVFLDGKEYRCTLFFSPEEAISFVKKTLTKQMPCLNALTMKRETKFSLLIMITLFFTEDSSQFLMTMNLLMMTNLLLRMITLIPLLITFLMIYLMTLTRS